MSFPACLATNEGTLSLTMPLAHFLIKINLYLRSLCLSYTDATGRGPLRRLPVPPSNVLHWMGFSLQCIRKKFL